MTAGKSHGSRFRRCIPTKKVYRQSRRYQGQRQDRPTSPPTAAKRQQPPGAAASDRQTAWGRWPIAPAAIPQHSPEKGATAPSAKRQARYASPRPATFGGRRAAADVGLAPPERRDAINEKRRPGGRTPLFCIYAAPVSARSRRCPVPRLFGPLRPLPRLRPIRSLRAGPPERASAPRTHGTPE